MTIEETLIAEIFISQSEESYKWHRLLLSDLEAIAVSLGGTSIEVHTISCDWLGQLGYKETGAHLVETLEERQSLLVYHFKKLLIPSQGSEPSPLPEKISPEEGLISDLFAALHREYGDPQPPSN